MALWLRRDQRDIKFAGNTVLFVAYIFLSYWLYLRLYSAVERFLP